MSSSLDFERVNTIVRKAGKLLEKLSKDPSQRIPQNKGDGSPVTPADLELSRYLVEQLEPLGFPVVSEERLEDLKGASQYFLVDPLDGTKYFARGQSEYAVCVGWVDASEACYGSVYDPIQSQLYWGVKGYGAYCDQRRIRHGGVGDSLRAFSSGFHHRPEKTLLVEKLQIGTILEKGSALKFCDLAEGKADLYLRFGPTSEWDTAGAQVFLEEAGCGLYEIATLKPLRYGKKQWLNRGLIAGESSVIPEVIELIAQHEHRWTVDQSGNE